MEEEDINLSYSNQLQASMDFFIEIRFGAILIRVGSYF